MSTPNGYYHGGRPLNEQWRHELAGDAEKLRARQMAERRRLDDDKQLLQNDLDSHLTPLQKSKTKSMTNPNGIQHGNHSENVAVTNHKSKHHALFDSLKMPPITTTPKKSKSKTVHTPKRQIADSAKPKLNLEATAVSTNSADSNPKKEDSDSTVTASTITTVATAPTEVIVPKLTESVKPEELENGKTTSFHFDFAETDRVLESIQNTKNGQTPKSKSKEIKNETPKSKRKRPLKNGTDTNSPSRKRIKL